MKLYFATTNAVKAEETTAFFEGAEVKPHYDIEFRVIKHDVQEILHPDLKVVVTQKALAAYHYLNQPCLVEQSGLFFAGLPELPGPLGKIIWDAIGTRMCDFLRKDDTRLATARAIIGYCDGKQIRTFVGNTPGEIAEEARGEYNTSNWDPIFIPKGSTETYAEMGRDRKYQTSPLIKAARKFLESQFPKVSRSKTSSAKRSSPPADKRRQRRAPGR